MPATVSTASTSHRRVLSRTALPNALTLAKTQTYTEILPPAHTTHGSSRSGYSSAYNSIPTSSASSGAATTRSLAFSPLGTLLAAADARAIRVWNPERPGAKYSTELKLLASAVAAPASATTAAATAAAAAPSRPRAGAAASGPSGVVGTERVAWNPVHEAELSSVGSDGTVRIWDVRARAGEALVGTVKVGGEGFSMAWHPAGDELVVGRKDDVLLRIDRRMMATLSTHPQHVQTNGITFTNSGRELLLTTGEGTVKFVDYPSLDLLHTLNAHTSSCLSVAQCPRGRHIAIGGADALVTVWDTANLVCRHGLADAQGPVRGVSFSFDGSFVVGACDEGLGVLVAHAETGEYIHTIPTTHPAPCVAWHPNRYWIAYSGDPSGLKIVGAAGGSL